MSVASAIRKMVEAGFTHEQALLAADIFEAEAPAARDAAAEKRREWDRNRKRAAKGGIPPETVNAEFHRKCGIPPEIPSPSLSPSAPPMRDKTLPPRPTPISSPSERPRPQKRLCRLTIDFRPSQAMRDFAGKLGLSNSQIDDEAEKIRDWSMSSPNGTKLDWEATWRGWVRKASAAPPARAGPNGHKPEHLDPWAKAIHKAAREKNGYAEQEFSFDGLKDVTPDGDAGDVVEKHAVRS